jgi:hypothetical protein
VTPVSKCLMLESATALLWASMRHLHPYLTLYLLAVLRFMLPAKTTLSTSAAAASSCSLTLDKVTISWARSNNYVYRPQTRR